MMGCMLVAAFCPAFASAASVLPSAAAAHGEVALAQAASAPMIAAVSPASGPIGTLVTIRGGNFTASNVILLNGAQASFAAGSPVGSESGTSLQFRVTTCPSYQPQCPGRYVPPGDYKVTVVNANGTSNEATFALTSR